MWKQLGSNNSGAPVMGLVPLKGSEETELSLSLSIMWGDSKKAMVCKQE